MKSIALDTRLRSIVTTLAVSALFAFSVEAVSGDTLLLEPISSGKAVELLSRPERGPSIPARPASLPLRVEGKAVNGYYPVMVDGSHYWVDGMDVKVHRDSKTACTMSAGVPAAGTLGAATNRCVSK